MSRRTELGELREGQVLDGVELRRAEAVALTTSGLVSVQPAAVGWTVRAAHSVGAIRCGELDVRVAPKVGAVQVLRLLARAYGVAKLRIDESTIGVADEDDLTSVLAALFAAQAATAMAAGPLRGYRTEDQSTPVLRGRLRLRDQELRRFGVLTPLEVTVDEWTADTDENRRIRAAGRLLLRTAPTAPVRARLLRLDRLLADVCLPGPGSPLAKWTPTRLNVRLHPLLHLSDLVLRHATVEHRAGAVEVHGFVVSMAWLFETLVTRLLTECSGSRRVLAQQSRRLDTLGRLRIQPDLLVVDGERVVAVADTKYKLLDPDGTFPTADAYQLVTYCARLGLSTGHLIYAAGDPCPEPFDIEGTGVRLVVHSIDLQQPVEGIKARVRRFLEDITSPHADLPATLSAART